MDGQDYEEDGRLGPAEKIAIPSEDTHTSQPERNLQPGDPNLVGGAPPAEKKGMADKVKGLFGGMKKGHHEADTDSAVGSGVGHTPDASPYGTPDGDDYNGRSLDPTGAPAGASEFRSEDATDDGVPHPTDPEGVTNDQGGAALTDEKGNLKPGPHQKAVKREGIVSKIKDKLHGSN